MIKAKNITVALPILLFLFMLPPIVTQAQNLNYLLCPKISYFEECFIPPTYHPLPVPQPTKPTPQPLFPPETLSRDTPPLMRALLDNPTVENAQAYLAWQKERQKRIDEVQRLIKQLEREKRQ